MIDNILLKTICRFCPCVLFSNNYCKINFIVKNGSDLCSCYSKQDLWKFFLKNYFLVFFIDIRLSMFCNDMVKISEILNKWNFLITWSSKLPILSNFAYFAAIFFI